jgi:hypothetical protein
MFSLVRVGDHRGTKAQSGRDAQGVTDATGRRHQGDRLEIRRRLPLTVNGPAQAREALSEMAGPLAAVGVLSHAQLLVSELASHLVRLAPAGSQGTVDLDITLTPLRLRLQVTNHDPRPPLTREQVHDPFHGWELELVAELSDRWGMRHDGRTTLWLELDL